MRARARLDRDETFLEAALREARRALRMGEVPIGALVVSGEDVLGRGFNRPIRACDPTAHAEIVALRQAGRRTRNYRLGGATLYVTVEPCLMCLGAAVQARVGRLVYGAADPKVRTLSGPEGLLRYAGLNHHFEVRGEVLAEEARALLREFFARRRAARGTTRLAVPQPVAPAGRRRATRPIRGEVPKWS